MNPIFTGIVENGKLALHENEKFKDYLHSLKGNVELILRPIKNQRSSNQNRYYWGVVVKLISEHTGLNKEQTHRLLLEKFLSEQIVYETKDGTTFQKIPKSSTEVSTAEFEEFLFQIKIWVAEEFSLEIPDPESVDV